MSCCLQRTNGAPNLGPAPGSTVVDQGVILQGVDATLTNFHGTVDDQVMRFNGATTQLGGVVVTTWLTIADSVTLGTTFTVLQPGVYFCNLYLPQAAGSTVQLGVTLNAPASVRQNSFNPTMPTVEDNAFVFGGILESGNSRAVFVITQAMITAGNNVIRAQCGDVANGPPAAGVFAVPTDVNIRIERVGAAA